MKSSSALLVLLLSSTLAIAEQVKLRDGITPRRLPPIKLSPAVALPEVSWEEMRSVLMTKGELKAGFIEADVTDYALQIVANIDKLIIHYGLDPLELSEEGIKLFPTGTLNLTNGWLEELSTLNISDPVIAKYSSSTKIFELTLPISFSSLLITYDYLAKILLISIDGAVDAKVSDVRLDLHMGFNFSSYRAFVDKADVKDTGKITIKFTGLGLLDWIIDLMDGVLVTLFHGLILSVVDLIIQTPVDALVDAINEFIDEILRRNSTELLGF